MKASELNVVTGAFSYTGKYITERLLAMGKNVMTLTGHPKGPIPLAAVLKPSHLTLKNQRNL